MSGSLNGYTVAGQPVSLGRVVVGGDTYTYTPTAAARLQAALTTQPDLRQLRRHNERATGDHGDGSDSSRGCCRMCRRFLLRISLC